MTDFPFSVPQEEGLSQPAVHISTPLTLGNPPEGRPQADEIPLSVPSC